MDLHYTALTPDPCPSVRDKVVWNARQRFKVRQVLESQKQQKWQTDISDLFESNDDIRIMRTRYTERFFQIYSMAYFNYIAGEWKVAKGLFEETQTMLGEVDGPSTLLLSFMKA